MNNLLQYLAESGLALLLFYLVYVLLLSRQTCFAFNRFYLLAALLFSFLIPFLELPDWPTAPELPADTTFIQVQSTGVIYQTPIVQTTKVETINYWVWLYGIYASGLITAGIIFCRHFLKLYTFIYSHTAEGYYWEQIKIIPTNGKMATFSFLHYILFDNTQPFTPAEKELILRHEQAHLMQKHTFDILYIKLLTILFWFNPLLYFYKKALESTHEYLADAQVLQEKDSKAYAALLVQQVFHKTGFSLVNFFHLHKSLTLKRLAMMKKIKNSSAFIRPLLALPIVCAVALVFASNQSVSVPDLVPKVSTTNELTQGLGFSDDNRRNDFTKNINYARNSDEWLQEPVFPGGQEQMYGYFLQNLKFAPEALRAISDKEDLIGLTASLKIDKEGNLEIDRNTETVTSKSKSFQKKLDLLDQEYYRVIDKMPRWTPAHLEGKPVASTYMLSLTVRLNPSKATPNVEVLRNYDSDKKPIFYSAHNFGLNANTGKLVNLLQDKPQSTSLGTINEPTFPGGKAAMEKYFKERLDLSKVIENEIVTEKEFSLVVIFMLSLDKNGNYSKRPIINNRLNATDADLSPTKTIKHNLENELVPILNNMPKWQPPTKDGKAISSLLFFSFNLYNTVDPPKKRSPEKYETTPDGKIIFSADAINFWIPFKKGTNETESTRTVLNKPTFKSSDTNSPQFPGGKVALRNFLTQNTKYPATALINKIPGQTIIQATIDADGYVINFKTLQADNTLFEQEAIRVLKEMPRWQPATKDGKVVPVNVAFPFVFGLENNRNLPDLKLPANRSKLYIQDAVRIMGYSQVVAGKTVIKKGTIPSSTNMKLENATPTNDKIFTFVEQQPSFKGGDQELNKFIRTNLQYPAEAQQKGVTGLVVVQFTVDITGKVSDPKVVKSLGASTDEEAIRVIKLMPDFSPAKQNGKPVNFRYTLPIRFGLSNNSPDPGKSAEPTPNIPDKIFTFVEQQAEFPGGIEAMNKFMKENLKYPEAARQNKEQGLVVIQFMVNKLGKISNPKVVKSLGKEFDEEAIRVVNQMPDFAPAKQNGIPVNFNYTLPIRFGL